MGLSLSVSYLQILNKTKCVLDIIEIIYIFGRCSDATKCPPRLLWVKRMRDIQFSMPLRINQADHTKL